jgi:hypothetical protein
MSSFLPIFIFSFSQLSISFLVLLFIDLFHSFVLPFVWQCQCSKHIHINHNSVIYAFELHLVTLQAGSCDMGGNGRNFHQCSWRNWENPRQISVRIIRIPTKIRPEHLPNTSQNSYRFAHRARWKILWRSHISNYRIWYLPLMKLTQMRGRPCFAARHWICQEITCVFHNWYQQLRNDKILSRVGGVRDL